MSRPVLEIADIFRDHGAAWRRANVGHVSLDQMKVMSAIERCRTAALGGHVARCEDCPHTVIAYNSCRNRHCPKCQGAAANPTSAVWRWLKVFGPGFGGGTGTCVAEMRGFLSWLEVMRAGTGM